jgi:hypothetical protein
MSETGNKIYHERMANGNSRIVVLIKMTMRINKKPARRGHVATAKVLMNRQAKSATL